MKNVALIYDNTIRPDTTGIYVRRALQEVASVVHFLPTQIDRIQPEYDLYLCVDDGLTYRWTRPDLHPSAWWIIDTHLQFDWDKQKAVDFDLLFTAQRNGAERLRLEGFQNVEWLPVGCDPKIHRRIEGVEKEYNVCFVGNLFAGGRAELLELIKDEIPRVHVGQAYFDEMAKIYSQSKIIFNCSIKDDINMRVFEATSCGSLLITNHIENNGQEELFVDGEDLVTYRSPEELIEKIQHFLQFAEERERIAQNGMEKAQACHTYGHRVDTILSRISVQQPKPVIEPTVPATKGKTTIVIAACNVVGATQQCIDSIMKHTHAPYNVIAIDNGSSDETPQYLKTMLAGPLRDRLQVITNKINEGFPKAANQALRLVLNSDCYKDTTSVLFLNNDTIVSAYWLSNMLRIFIEYEDVGIVGPGTNNCSGVQRVNHTSYTDHESMQEFACNFYRVYRGFSLEVERIVGFCMLVRREVFEQIGILDEQFGIGNFEDDDLCTRAAQANWKLRLAGDTFVHHFGQQTFKAIGIDYKRLMQENLEKYIGKYPDGGLHKDSIEQTSGKNSVEQRFPTVTN